MRVTVTILLVCSLVAHPAPPGLGSEKARYAGGTLEGIAENTEGKLQLTETAAIFVAERGRAASEVSIPYEAIEQLEYGQKAGRRLGAAIAVSPLLLFSKKRKHFLTIGFVDEEGNKQGVVFELGKRIVRETLATLEARSKVAVEYESDEARKHVADLK